MAASLSSDKTNAIVLASSRGNEMVGRYDPVVGEDVGGADLVGAYSVRKLPVSGLAKGGNQVYALSDGSNVHVFTSSGTFTLFKEVQADILVVAGGGGGGGASLYAPAGGGGGGEVIYQSVKVPPGTFRVTVGNGGAANANGGDSKFGPYEAKGGGAGGFLGSSLGGVGNSGGSGGGGDRYSIGGTSVKSSIGLGNDGGSVGADVRAGQGGGGATQVGFTSSGDSGGNGGQGFTTSITGTSEVYGSGGGGGRRGFVSNGIGGTNAGNGGLPGGNGVANRGGGGGGGQSTGGSNNAFDQTQVGSGGSGGSGIVIVRFLPSAATGPAVQSGYRGPALRVRRDTDNALADVWTDTQGGVSKISEVQSSGGEEVLDWSRLHVFRTSGTFTVSSGSVVADVLVVAGGGGGGRGSGSSCEAGGGGAGGVIYQRSLQLSSNQTVTVGNGGASQTNGQNSSFGSIVSTGGGAGGSASAGSSGGSGGGGAHAWAGGSGSSAQGNAGAGGTVFLGINATYSNSGGGGGGAGSPGNFVFPTHGGKGAFVGDFKEIAGSPGGWFGGGGQGGAWNTQLYLDNPFVSLGGGGSSNPTRGVGTPTPGVPNTGGGGGGSHYCDNTMPGGSGGSGIVIVRVHPTHTGRDALSQWLGSSQATVVTWYDQSGSGNHATDIRGNPRLTLFGTKNYLYGTTADGLRFPASILPSTYTLFHVARYADTGTRRRIFSSHIFNWLSGFWGERSGVSHHDDVGFITQSSTDIHGRNLVVSVDGNVPNLYRSNGTNRTVVTSNSVARQLSINRCVFGEDSDWIVHEVLVYNSTLPLTRILKTERALMQRYLGATDEISLASRTGARGLYALRQVSGTWNGPTLTVTRTSDGQRADVYFDANGKFRYAVVDNVLAFKYGNSDGTGGIFANATAVANGLGTVTLVNAGSDQTEYTWTPPAGQWTADVLVVAGGGAGGAGSSANAGGGGGGGGEVVYRNTVSIQNIVQIIIGRGGNALENGNDSKFQSWNARGGGSGGNEGGKGSDGGSGGGSGRYSGSGRPGGVSTAMDGLGNKGGDGGDGANLQRGGGGGGGATQPGSNVIADTGGSGGQGFSTDISGVTNVYGSGGGGGSHNSSFSASGGINAGSGGSPGTNAVQHTGSGGGGGRGGTTVGAGGNGGSGIVLVRLRSANKLGLSDFQAWASAGPVLENPKMTSNTTVNTDFQSVYGWDTNSGWAASASFQVASTTASGAFNKILDGNIGSTDGWQGATQANMAANPEWLRLDFPYMVNVTRYEILSRNGGLPWAQIDFPNTFQVQGSNDGTNWTTIDSRSGQANLISSSFQTLSYTVSTTLLFRYYRLYITGVGVDNGGRGNGTFNPAITEMRYFVQYPRGAPVVETWYDQSGNARHATQAITGRKWPPAALTTPTSYEPDIVTLSGLAYGNGTYEFRSNGMVDSLDPVNYGAWRAFDGSTGTRYSGYANHTDASGNIGGYGYFVSIKLPQAIVLSSYSILGPVSWEVYGVNADNTLVLLDKRTDVSSGQVYSVSSSGSFATYRFVPLKMSISSTINPFVWLNSVNIYEIALYDTVFSGSPRPALRFGADQAPYLDFRTSRFFTLPDGTVPTGNAAYSFVVQHGDIDSTDGTMIGSGTTGTINSTNNLRRNVGQYRNFWWSNDHIFGTYTKDTIVSVSSDGTNHLTYINGIAAQTRVSSARNTDAFFNRIGIRRDGAEPLNGDLYYVGIFGTALSQSEIQSLGLRAQTKPVGALDSIGTSPAAAFGLRQLYGSYTGPVVRVRRSADSVEADVFMNARGVVTRVSRTDNSADLYGSRALSTFQGMSTIFVTTWYDQSGRGNHASNAITTTQPQLAQQSGKYVMYFDGNSDVLKFTGIFVLTVWSQFYVIALSNAFATIVGREGSLGGVALRFANRNVAQNEGDLFYTTDNSAFWYVNNVFGNTLNAEPRISVGSWQTIYAVRPTPYVAVNQIGYRSHDPQNRDLNGYIGELIMYDTALDANLSTTFFGNRLIG